MKDVTISSLLKIYIVVSAILIICLTICFVYLALSIHKLNSEVNYPGSVNNPINVCSPPIKLKNGKTARAC
jgi:hypothetical protein